MSEPVLETRLTDDTAIAVVIPAKVDGANAEALGEQLYQIVDKSGYHKVHLDFGDLHYVDGQALGKLVGLSKKLRVAGGEPRPLITD